MAQKDSPAPWTCKNPAHSSFPCTFWCPFRVYPLSMPGKKETGVDPLHVNCMNFLCVPLYTNWRMFCTLFLRGGAVTKPSFSTRGSHQREMLPSGPCIANINVVSPAWNGKSARDGTLPFPSACPPRLCRPRLTSRLCSSPGSEMWKV